MAHAYETFAQRGELTYGTLSPGDPDNRKVTPIPGPVGIEAIGRGAKDDFEPLEVGGRKLAEPQAHAARALPRDRRPGRLDPADRREVRHRHARVRAGRHRRPARPAPPRATATPGSSAGRRSTPSRSGSATRTSFKPMETEFQGDPVAGGTYPAGHLQDVRRGARRASRRSRRTRPRPRRPCRPAARPAASRTRRATPDTGGAIEGGGAPPASTPVPQQEAPAEPGARAGAGARPSRRRSSLPSRRRSTPAEPPPDTGGAEPAPGTG